MVLLTLCLELQWGQLALPAGTMAVSLKANPVPRDKKDTFDPSPEPRELLPTVGHD